MKSTNKKGFTLVELIIVITILAILATIAFVSFQSYTKDARNSKRTSDLSSISSAIEVKLANAVSILDLVDAGTPRTKGDTDGSIGGTLAGAAATASKYKATNKINFNVVGAKAEDFADPKGGATYLIGATTLAGGAYEVATELYETDAGTGSKIIGNYKPRTLSNTGTISSTGTLNATLGAGLGIFKVGDITNQGEITGVSNDLSRLTFKTQPSTGNIVLTGSLGEIKSLISGLN